MVDLARELGLGEMAFIHALSERIASATCPE